MQDSIIFAVFLLLLTKSQASTYDDDAEPLETEKQFILDQHKNTIEIFKSEMERFFGNLITSLNQKQTTSDSKVEMLFSNLSDTFTQNLAMCNSNSENTFLNVSEIFNQTLKRSDSGMEISLANLTNLFLQKLATSDLKISQPLANLSETINLNLKSSESKSDLMDRTLANLTEIFRQKLTAIELQLESSLANMSEEFTRKLTTSESKMESMERSLASMSEEFSRKRNTRELKMEILERSLSNKTEEFTRKLTTSESKMELMESSLANITEAFNKRVSASDSKTESFYKSLGQNLTTSMKTAERSLSNQMEALNLKQARTDSKLGLMERSLADVSQKINSKASDSKLETSLASLSHSFNQSLSKINSELRIEIMNYQVFGLPIGVPFKDTSGNFQTIIFGKELNHTSDKRSYTKYWMLQVPNVASTRFYLKVNSLGPNDKLIFSGVSTAGDLEQFKINSQTSNGVEFTIKGFVVFVALTINSESIGNFHSSIIKLEYHTNSTGVETQRSYRYQTITKEGLQEVSFPEGNTQNYANYATSVILIAPPSGTEFKITLTYLEVEPCSNCNCDRLKVFSLDGNSTSSSSPSRQRPDSTKRWCSRTGVTSETLGYSTAAVLFFRSDRSNRGRGYKVEIRPQ